MTRELIKTSTPGVYKRGGRYVVVFRDWQGKQRKRSARTLAEARRLKASLSTDVERGEFVDSRVTFAQYAPEWIDAYRGRTDKGVKAETLADYRKTLERDALPFFGRIRLSHIRPSDIKEYARELEAKGASVGTVRVKLAPLKALLADALEDGLIRSNPAAGVTIKSAPATGDVEDEDEMEHVKALNSSELAAVLAALPDEWRLFFRFLADSGLRIGEAVALKWADIDAGGALVQVRRRRYRGRIDRPKSKYGRRRARISDNVARELRTFRAGRHDDELVFPNQAGSYLDPGNVMARVLKPAAVKAGFGRWVVANGRRHAESWVGFHTFRHTCATALFEAGWNAKQVQLQLGHHKPSFTLDTYIHLMPGDLPMHPFSRGNEGASRPTEKGRETSPTKSAQTMELPGLARLQEVTGARS